MASRSGTSGAVPNTVFRRLRGQLSPGEFAAAVRKAAREIGEQVSCDARYIGRVEAGEIRCPNYAYERVFLHMYPGLTLKDLGFAERERVRGGRRGTRPTVEPAPERSQSGSEVDSRTDSVGDEENDVLRRAFMTGGSATVAAASFGLGAGLGLGPVLRSGNEAQPGAGSVPLQRRVGEPEVAALEEAVRRIRLLDDRHGAEGLYQRAAQPLRAAYALLDAGITTRRATTDRLHTGAGELALSVGWLAHDSGRFDDARSHYAEALSTARVSGDQGLEAHAFSNTSFLARDAGRYREAVRSAQAGLGAARGLGSPRLMALLALREAGGWAGLGDRSECARALGWAHGHFARGAADADPEWMSFFGEPEVEALQAQCWAALGDWQRAISHARRASSLQDRRFTRNLALYRAELAANLARGGAPEEAAEAGLRVLELLDGVQSTRIEATLTTTATALRGHRSASGVSEFLGRYGGGGAVASGLGRLG
ncbi:tetratricopeptide repeat protein [Streptomyces albipurpureus]|uniref:Tetratricopeptide repeat protein n=1 Tax=Streptomyces albipurpureus TaxID=2897419 RepID=A0ABT0UVB3_9ACTN|nr:tetratricopeptide repeat protein [Streptomyces sp. CWNU-1]MCM2392181.1 tetratricopeptide repeat protein [Streptomyces sp. CWNU-1]